MDEERSDRTQAMRVDSKDWRRVILFALRESSRRRFSLVAVKDLLDTSRLEMLGLYLHARDW